MKKPKILVNLKTYQRKWRIDRSAARIYLQRVWNLAGATHASPLQTEVTIVFLNDAQMRCYNKRYRNKDYPTDVLSFPVNEILDQGHYLGDIVISLEKTAVQAMQKGHSFDRELKILLLHGVLHLLGYDHETDSGQMDHLEARLRRILAGARNASALTIRHRATHASALQR